MTASRAEAPASEADAGQELDARERMVTAALEVFLEKGYDGTRVQDIADRAGYTPGALYVHFPNRSTLLSEAIVMEGGRVLADLVARLAALKPGRGKVARAMAEQAASESNTLDRLVLEALALAARDATARDELSVTLGSLDRMVARHYERAVADGIIDPAVDPDSVTSFFSSWILGMIVHRAVGRPKPDVDAYSAMADRVTSSLSPRH